MNLVDLLIILLLLWGGIAGYLSGAQRMFNRVCALLSAIGISSCFKQEIQSILDRTYPVAGFVRETVTRRFATPVALQSFGTESSILQLLNRLQIKVPPFPVGSGNSVGLELICLVVLNAIYFGLAFVFWLLICNVLFSFYQKRIPGALTRPEQLAGLGMGVVSAGLSAALVLGIALPLSSVFLPFDLPGTGHSVLFQMVRSLIGYMGIW